MYYVSSKHHDMQRFAALLLGLVLLVGLSTSALQAQDVRLSGGVRVGGLTGLSLRAFLSDQFALEGVASYRPLFGISSNTFSTTAIGMYHWDLDLEDEFEPLSVYGGLGVGATWFNSSVTRVDNNGVVVSRRETTLLPSVRLLIGAHYAFEDAPLELTLDTGPGFRRGFSVLNGFFFGATLGARYIIARR